MNPLAIRLLPDSVEFSRLKAQEFDLEVFGLELFELKTQKFYVPPGQLGELVVRDDIGADLAWSEVRDADHRHSLQADEFCGLDAGMARDDAIVLISENWRVEPKRPDAIRYFPDILFEWVRGLRACGDNDAGST